MTAYKLVPVEPTRDDLIQCLLATRGQSEGATADAILSMLADAPVVEQEPVAWLWGSSNCTTDKEMSEGFEQRTPGSTTPLYLQSQPAPDVTQLVEALDLSLEYWRDRQQRYKNRRPKWVIAAESALAAYRNGGEE